MSFNANVIRVLIASPSDLVEERKIAIETVYHWNAQHAEAESVVLLPVAWETHATPRSGVRPQAAINDQIVDRSDILIGMFWTKLGTSTGVAQSGTVEEIERFIAAGKPTLLYFSKRPIDPGAIDPKQNRRLKAFKETTQNNALVGTFDSLDALKELISRHLLSEVRLLNLRTVRGTAISTTVGPTTTSEDMVEAEHNTPETPLESWNQDTFEMAMFYAIYNKDDTRFKLIDEAYHNHTLYSEADNAPAWQACVEWARLRIGNGGQLKRLEKLAEDNPDSARTLFYLGKAYDQFDKHQMAGDAYLASIKNEKLMDVKADRASDAINAFRKAKNTQKVNETLAMLRVLANDKQSIEAVLTATVRTMVEDEGDKAFGIALLERHIELNPDDHNARFQLAFKHSEAGNEATALHHYYKIPHGERNGITWNNIGAAADQLELPAKAVAAFVRASDMDETLAMANLGFKLLNVGFETLAREQCTRALKHPKPHPNVGNLVTALASLEENEKTHQKSVLDGIEVQVSHLQRLGQAATRATPEQIAKDWQGPSCVLKCVRRGDKISFTGTYERDDNFLAALATPPTGLGRALMPASKSKYFVRYSGTIRGLAVIGEYKHEREGATLLGNAGEKDMFMILSEDGAEISLIERSDFTTHVLTRIS